MDLFFTQILAALAKYGYPVVFFGTIADNSGIPIYMLAVSILAGMGHLEIISVILLSILASIIRDQICFWIGKWNSQNRKYLSVFHPRVMAVYRETEKIYLGNSAAIVIWGRALLGVGNYLPILAGIYDMKFLKFTAYSVIGSVILMVSFGLWGYYFGYPIWHLVKTLRYFNLLILISIILICFLIIRKKVKIIRNCQKKDEI